MDLETMLAFFQPAELRDAIRSSDYTDVMINADRSVFVDHDGKLVRLPFKSGPVLVGIQNIARILGKDFSKDRPMLDARLPDGSRVAAMLHQDNTCDVTIRRFNRWFSSDELVAVGALTEGVRETLAAGICGVNGDAANILFSGGTSSGKSTQIKAIIDHIPQDRKLIVIEKPRELALSHECALRWEAEDEVMGQTPTRSVAQYLAAALRHRPDHIIIGEVREPEAAYQMLQAMNTGHSGTLSTIHADSAEDALRRITNLALAAHSNLSQEFMRSQVAQTIDLVCHVARDANGKRAVRELIKVKKSGDVEYLYGRAA